MHDDEACCKRQSAVFNVAQCDYRHSKIDVQGRFTVQINTQAERDEAMQDMEQRITSLESNQTTFEKKVACCCCSLLICCSRVLFN